MNAAMVSPGHLLVTLSRRNLLTLLQKVDLPAGESQCQILRLCDNGMTVVVKAEVDEVHYGGREEPPGEMRADAEAFIEDHASKLGSEEWER